MFMSVCCVRLLSAILFLTSTFVVTQWAAEKDDTGATGVDTEEEMMD